MNSLGKEPQQFRMFRSKCVQRLAESDLSGTLGRFLAQEAHKLLDCGLLLLVESGDQVEKRLQFHIVFHSLQALEL
jgi:hypothetical protein